MSSTRSPTAMARGAPRSSSAPAAPPNARMMRCSTTKVGERGQFALSAWSRKARIWFLTHPTGSPALSSYANRAMPTLRGV